MYNLTETQQANLDKLATYLESLPEDYEHFNMKFYNALVEGNSDERDMSRLKAAISNPCGTVACAVGHGPAAGIDFEDCFAGTSFNWRQYAEKLVTNEFEEDFMFGFEWHHVDDTHRGAAARIRYILDGNVVPNDFITYGNLRYSDDDDCEYHERLKSLYEGYLV